ncbi:MAG: phosphotransferase, partial [Alphaproteobacteria bacterium]|nr:phosphotransferase [Alphaproteobacteria bacterium]
DRAAELVAIVCPQHKQRIAAVVDRLKALAPNDAASPIATLHGDCHAKNVLVVRDEIALIDLDNVAIGPPLHDVGSFAAALIHGALVTRRPVGDVLSDIGAFVESYRRNVPWPVSDEAVAWYTATALLQERVYRTITRLKPGRLGLIGVLIDLADDLQSDGLNALDRRQPALA